MQRYTVMVVDDSAFMRKIITDLISEDPAFEVIGTAKNGEEAVKKAREWKPDAITMDVEMPVMNGLEALQVIMSEMPTPVLMLSSLTDEGARETIAALAQGAVDFVRKPSGSISLDLYKVKDILLDKLKTAVKAKVNKIPSPTVKSPVPTNKQRTHPRTTVTSLFKEPGTAISRVVAIGTSTGGPKALQTVLSALPGNFPAPIIVVQHMPPNFTRSLADRLNSICELQVVEAEHDMVLIEGTVYIAPGGQHMRVNMSASGGLRIQLSKEAPRSGHRPSVDTMFESLVPLNGLKRYAVIMTGMGADGAKGIKDLRNNGAVATIAESEETCIVYGMPRAAVEMQGIDQVVKLQDIPHKLIELLQSRT